MRLMTTALMTAPRTFAAPAKGPRGTARVAEIVPFPLKNSSDTTAAPAAKPVPRSTRARVHRRLSVDCTGRTDHIGLTDQTATRRASNQMFDRSDSQPFLAVIAATAMVLRDPPVQMEIA